MRRRWVIPDIHGHVNTLKALFEEQIKPTRYDEIYFLGDYIDRGPASKEVLDFIMFLQKDEYNVTALKGNHEDMLAELHDSEKQSKANFFSLFSNKKRAAWMAMGGKETLSSFGVGSAKDVPPAYIDWIRGLPYFVELEEWVLVHAGLNFKIEDPFSDKISMLWLRDYEIRPEMIGNRRIIHGHVPVNLELISLSIRNRIYRFIDLDNGIYVRNREGYGNLVALELTGMEMVIGDNRDI